MRTCPEAIILPCQYNFIISFSLFPSLQFYCPPCHSLFFLSQFKILIFSFLFSSLGIELYEYLCILVLCGEIGVSSTFFCMYHSVSCYVYHPLVFLITIIVIPPLVSYSHPKVRELRIPSTENKFGLFENRTRDLRYASPLDYGCSE